MLMLAIIKTDDGKMTRQDFVRIKNENITIDVMSRFLCEHLFHNIPDNAAVISISGDGIDEPADIHGQHCLRLNFCDSEDEAGDFPGIQTSDAFAIAQFITNLPASVNHIVIHCYAGQSRSAGVGVAIASHFDIPAEDIFKYCIPSTRCSYLVSNAFDSIR